MWIVTISLFFLVAPVMPPVARCQVSTGTITGTVTDSSGAAVSGAQVTVTQVAQNLNRTLVTNSYGIYEVKFLPVGGYKVTAEQRQV